MYSKLEITGVIELVTGMHIGAADSFSAIGAIDSPVARDLLSGLPYIPGSSIKGKMRALLAKAYNSRPVSSRDEDDVRITRLFGASKGKEKDAPIPSRVLFADSILSNSEELAAAGADAVTEAKEENTIDPLISTANPRQIERVIRGAQFPLNIIYNVTDKDELIEDFGTLRDAIMLLEYDYLGGHGSRGYGRVKISNLTVDCVVGDIEESVLAECSKILQR